MAQAFWWLHSGFDTTNNQRVPTLDQQGARWGLAFANLLTTNSGWARFQSPAGAGKLDVLYPATRQQADARWRRQSKPGNAGFILKVPAALAANPNSMQALVKARQIGPTNQSQQQAAALRQGLRAAMLANTTMQQRQSGGGSSS